MMNRKKIILSVTLAFISGFSVVSVMNFLREGSFSVVEILSSVPFRVYLMALFIFILSYIVEALRLMALLRFRGYKLSFLSSLYNNFIGYFFSYLTPFAIGGQPFQVFHMVKHGVDSAYAAGLMGLRILENSIGGAIVAIVMLNTSLGWILKKGHMVMIGIVISLTVSAFLMLAMLKPSVLTPLVRFVSAVFKVDLEESFSEWREKFEKSVNYLLKENPFAVLVDSVGWFLVVNVQMFSLFYIVTTISKDDINYWLMFGGINAVNALAYFIPTPGASGGIEATYQLVLSAMTSGDCALRAITSWRLIAYYLQILFGIVVLWMGMLKEEMGG